MRRGELFCHVHSLDGGIMCVAAWAQTPAVISLAQAQQIALQNHPRIASAALTAEASRVGRQGGSLGLLSNTVRQLHRRRRGAWFDTLGGLRYHLEHLQPRGVGRGCESTPDRLRPHIEP